MAIPTSSKDLQHGRASRSNSRKSDLAYRCEQSLPCRTGAETVQNAKERLMELVSNMEQEFAIESLIRAKGFLDAAVTLRSDAISVIIDGETLSDEEVARILDIVQTETGAEASKIKISLSRG